MKLTAPKLNATQQKLAEKVIAQIRAEANNFSMDRWFEGGKFEETYDKETSESIDPIPAKKVFSCGTTACLAGHIVVAAGYPAAITYTENMKLGRGKFTGDISDVALNVLGIDNDTDLQIPYEERSKIKGYDDDYFGSTSPGERLFHVSNWPNPFRDEYLAAEESGYSGELTEKQVNRKKASITIKRFRHFLKTGV